MNKLIIGLVFGFSLTVVNLGYAQENLCKEKGLHKYEIGDWSTQEYFKLVKKGMISLVVSRDISHNKSIVGEIKNGKVFENSRVSLFSSLYIENENYSNKGYTLKRGFQMTLSDFSSDRYDKKFFIKENPVYTEVSFSVDPKVTNSNTDKKYAYEANTINLNNIIKNPEFYPFVICGKKKPIRESIILTSIFKDEAKLNNSAIVDSQRDEVNKADLIQENSKRLPMNSAVMIDV